MFQKIISKYIQVPEIKNATINLIFSISSFILVRSFATQIGLEEFGKYNYFVTTIIALVAVLDFGVSSAIISKIFKLNDSKAAFSMSIAYTSAQLIILLVVIFIWRIFDSFLRDYILFDFIIILFIVYYNKTAWNILVSYFIKYRNLNYLFLLSIIYACLSIYLTFYWPEKYNPLYVFLAILAVIYFVPVLVEGLTQNYSIRKGCLLVIETITTFKSHLFILLLARVLSSFCSWVERFFLVEGFGYSKQAVFGIGIICLNILGVFLSGAFRVLWSNNGKFSKILNVDYRLQKYSVLLLPIYFTVSVLFSFIILFCFEIEVNIHNILFFYILFISSPLLVFAQYHTVILYNLDKYKSVSKVVIYSSIINIILIVVFYSFSNEDVILIDFALKGLIVLICTLLTFKVYYDQETKFTNTIIIFGLLNIVVIKMFVWLYV